MTDRTKGTIALFVAVFLAFVVLIVMLNLPAESSDLEKVNTPTEFEGGTIELTSYSMEASPDEQRHMVAKWRGTTKVVPLAAPGCKKILTFDRALNKYDATLFSIQVTASWCWRDGRLTVTDFSRDYNVGDEWWNLYKFRAWKQPVRTTRPHYAYNRQGAYFEACAAWCFIDSDVWVAQTVNLGGSYTAACKGDEDCI